MISCHSPGTNRMRITNEGAGTSPTWLGPTLCFQMDDQWKDQVSKNFRNSTAHYTTYTAARFTSETCNSVSMIHIMRIVLMNFTVLFRAWHSKKRWMQSRFWMAPTLRQRLHYPTIAIRIVYFALYNLLADKVSSLAAIPNPCLRYTTLLLVGQFYKTSPVWLKLSIEFHIEKLEWICLKSK